MNQVETAPHAAQSAPIDLGAILATSSSAVVVLDKNHHLRYSSPRFAQLLQLQRKPGKAFKLNRYFAHPGTLNALTEIIERDGRVDSLDTHMVTHSGDALDIRLSGRPLGSEDGTFVLWLAQVGEQLRLERLLRTSFHFAPMPMLLVRAADGVVELSNRRAHELFGHAGTSARSRTIEEIFGKDDLRLLSERLAGGGFVDDFEIQLRTAYNESIWVIVSGQAAEIEGEKRLLLGFLDITESRSARDTLRRFFDAAPVPMILCRCADGSVLRLNDHAYRLFGPTEKGERNIEAFFDPFAGLHLMNAIKDGKFADGVEIELRTLHPGQVWGQVSVQCIPVGNDLCALIGIDDISQRKREEEQLRKAKAEAEAAAQSKAVFLATMSHEIRTPMNGVLGMVDVLHRTQLDWEQRNMVNVIRESARALLSIIDDILDLSKIEAGHFRMESIPFSLRELVADTIDLMTARARDNGNEIAALTGTNVPDGLVGDPARLRQIMLNLLGNALKFTSSGHVDLVVEMIDQADGYVALRFEVTDTGIGLADEEADKVFQPFIQADDHTARKFGGTGLGLSICSRLVKMMGGTLGVVSRKGEGSTFWFELPFLEQPIPRPRSGIDLSGLNVLVLEPHPVTLKGVEDALGHAGAAVIPVDHPRKALAALRQARSNGPAIDILLTTDRHDLDGFGLAELLCETGKFPPGRIVVAIRSNREQFAERARRLGIGGLLTKPLNPTVLRRALAMAAGRLRAEPEPPPQAGSDQPVRPQTREKAIATNRLILVAEDHVTNRLVLGMQLERLGYVFDMVENGVQALEKLASRRYGALITDCQMPEMDGYALSMEIRRSEREQGLPPIPIIALTAAALLDDREKCRAAGMDEYLSKPVRYERLEDVLRNALPRLEDTDLTSPIDRAGLAEILGSDESDLICEILSCFPPAFTDALTAIERALDPLDRAALKAAVHTAKGAARNAAATGLANALQRLDQSASEADAHLLDELFDECKVRWMETTRYIDDLMARGEDCGER